MNSRSIVDAIAIGVAVVDDVGRFVSVNSAGALILGAATPDELPGVQSPFEFGSESAGSDADAERVGYWDVGLEDFVMLSYQFGSDTADGTVVTFRDVTDQRRQQRRVAALARTASNMAAQRSVTTSVLDAMAWEVQQSEGVAAAQFITVAPATRRLQVMGAAGFAEVHTFFDLLMASHRRGANLATYEVMDRGQQIVYPHRRAEMLADPDWQPIHAYISQLEWDDFVCTPLMTRGKSVGVLNVYMEPSYHAGHTMLDFFTAMADQASLAIDYATLLERDRIAVRREERKRLARDLHDSVVQQVFSIGMQARALQRMATKGSEPLATDIGRIAAEVGELSQAVQHDLRGVVLALQPSMAAEMGLSAALHLLAEKITRRTDIQIELSVSPELDDDDADFVEDVYQVVSESLHNAVKHAAPSTVLVSIEISDGPRVVRIEIIDDGSGLTNTSSTQGGYGLTSMRERVTRWSGHLDVTPNDSARGTRVTATLVPPPPHPDQTTR
ncbi:two-component system sensor kinase [Rhodococcus wratislaviensis]|uniref:Two-component system sensor kinase n=1 Tax=Rhodococcus wratislaviensis TaxID=44752 RepID=A0A402CIL0_RHOWR|nr:histidine kinase [Rhodococcus wratislaviensis]GCE43444.1 two-component system sensor kinase [Rhodococcus wratislaviensis]